MKVQSFVFGVPGFATPNDSVKVTLARCMDAVNQIPQYHIELKVTQPKPSNFDPMTWIGKQGVLVAKQTTDESGSHPKIQQYAIAGVIQSLQYRAGSNDDSITLKMTAWPSQSSTSYYKRNYQLFQNKTSLEIAQQLIEVAGGIFDKTMLQKDLTARECEVQYGESDTEFISRILADDNIIFNLTAILSGNDFPQSPVKIKMTAFASLNEFTSEPLLQNLERTSIEKDPGSNQGVFAVCSLFQQGVQKIISNSNLYPPEVSNLIVESEVLSNDSQNIIDILPDERFRTRNEGQAKIDMIREASQSSQFLFKSELLGVAPGNYYTLKNVKAQDFNICVTETVKVFTITVMGDFILEVSSKAQPQIEAYIPANIPRPQLPGLLYARVLDSNAKPDYATASSDDTVHTTALAQVKVRIDWPGNLNVLDTDHPNFSGIWLRMMTPWAGHHAGFLAIPRVGQEVIVSFIHGDANTPVVLGSLYSSVENSGSLPPWNPADPANSKWVGLGTRTSTNNQYLRLSADPNDAGVQLSSAKYLNMFAQTDSRLHALHDINIEAGNDVNIKGLKHINLNSDNIKLDGNISTKLTSPDDWDIAQTRKTVIGAAFNTTGASMNNTGAELDITGLSTNITGISGKVTGMSNDVTAMANKVTANVNSFNGLTTEVTGLALFARLAELKTYGVSASLGGVDVSAKGVSIGLNGVTFNQSAFTIQC
jgi:type VI secretion system secreted protein VgrG